MAECTKILYQGGVGEIVEKKSRFIASVAPVATEQEALDFIAAKKKEYWDARHNCYAYIIGSKQEIMRCSDDGEPAQTAGRPMLDVLLSASVYNIVVIVTRYFGGVLLGTGGLVRAYQGATKAGLDASVLLSSVLVGNSPSPVTTMPMARSTICYANMPCPFRQVNLALMSVWMSSSMPIFTTVCRPRLPT